MPVHIFKSNKYKCIYLIIMNKILLIKTLSYSMRDEMNRYSRKYPHSWKLR